MNDLKRTQHYTTNYKVILKGLTDYIDFNNAKLIEPFVGNGDLLALAPQGQWEKYDLEGGVDCIKRDTLLNPPNYSDKTVITNPPFLAKNHAKDKSLFIKYKYDDLYKIFLDTVVGCKNGIVIVPGNFFCDEGSESIRIKFLSNYIIHRVNFFTYPVFNSTSYSVCAFAFSKKRNISQQVEFYVNNETPFTTCLNVRSGYRVAGEELNKIQSIPSAFNRLVLYKPSMFPTHIYLYAADTKDNKIRLEYREELYYGKTTDRMFATLDCKYALSYNEEQYIIQNVNDYLTTFRAAYHNLPFTNYRDNNRKRVGFDYIYKLCTYFLSQIRRDNGNT